MLSMTKCSLRIIVHWFLMLYKSLQLILIPKVFWLLWKATNIQYILYAINTVDPMAHLLPLSTWPVMQQELPLATDIAQI